jgi:ATP-dependent NAD(P)H-hydrate dehydratase
MRWILRSTRLPVTSIILTKLPSFLFLLAASSPSTSCQAVLSRGAATQRATFLNTSSSLLRRHMSSSSSINDTPKAVWVDKRDDAMARCVLPLSSTSHKGSSGRVGVLGGSARYTGAPYYAAMASLKVGADLSSVFCAEEAAGPIKSYSPELMVASVYSASQFDQLVDKDEKDSEEPIQKMVQAVTSMMDNLHCLVIGPGLGRCPIVLKATSKIIQEAQARKLPLVLDADALYLLTLDPYQKLLQPSSIVILTPNKMERKRLQGSETNLTHCIVIEKGQYDAVQYNGQTLTCGEEGGLKRSGGLGDLLAGTVGTLVAWNAILSKQGVASSEDMPLACWTGCCLVKRATSHAFEAHRRSMTAPDVLAHLGSTVNEMIDS